MLKKLLLTLILAGCILSTSFPILCMEVSLEPGSNRNIIESQEITSIMPYVDNSTLVIFDIDNTLIREMNASNLYPKLMDSRIPSMLLQLKRESFGVIALTHRRPAVAKKTFVQLKKVGIQLHKTPLAKMEFVSTLPRPVLYKKGVLFANRPNAKGTVFSEWLKQVSPQLDSERTIKRIIFIDDVLSNVISMQQAAKNAGFEFLGVRYSAGDQLKIESVSLSY